MVAQASERSRRGNPGAVVPTAVADSAEVPFPAWSPEDLVNLTDPIVALAGRADLRDGWSRELLRLGRVGRAWHPISLSTGCHASPSMQERQCPKLLTKNQVVGERTDRRAEPATEGPLVYISCSINGYGRP
jgi:hypothetical protein